MDRPPEQSVKTLTPSTPRMRSRLSRWFVRTAIVLAAAVVVLATAGWAALSLPPIGAPMSGARLERAQANPHYRDRRFVNPQPEAPTDLAAVGDYIVRQFSGSELREPLVPLPVLAVDKAALAPASSGLRAFWIGTPASTSSSTACACCSTRCSPNASRRCPSDRGASIPRRSRWPICRRSTSCSSRTTTMTIWTWTPCATWPHVAQRPSFRRVSAPISSDEARCQLRSKNRNSGSSSSWMACSSSARHFQSRQCTAALAAKLRAR